MDDRGWAPPQLTDRPWHEIETVRLPPPPAPKTEDEPENKATVKLSSSAEACDLRVLATTPSDRKVVAPDDSVLWLHSVLIDGREDEVITEPYERLQKMEIDADVTMLITHLYGGGGPDSRLAVRKRLMGAVERNEGDIAIRGTTLNAYKAILSLRSPVLAATIANAMSDELDLLGPMEWTPDEEKATVLRAVLEYLYTEEPAHRDAVIDVVFSQQQCEDSNLLPFPLRACYAFDERLYLDLREATLRRLEPDTGSAASLWRFADDFHDSSGAKKLRSECVALLAQPGGIAAARAAVNDPELFEQLLPESARRALEVLQLVSTSNPVARGAHIVDLREAAATLRESLDEQVDRLANAETRQRQHDASSQEEDTQTWDAIHKRRKAVAFLRDYVDKLEARVFAECVSPPQSRQDDGGSWTYEWRDVPESAVLPPGLEFKLTFGGARRARVPPSWQLRLYIGDDLLNEFPRSVQGGIFRRHVDQTTTVTDVLTDVIATFFFTAGDDVSSRGSLALVVAVVGDDNIETQRQLLPDDLFTPALWHVRDRIELRLLPP